jgi:hypothetical protein
MSLEAQVAHEDLTWYGVGGNQDLINSKEV